MPKSPQHHIHPAPRRCAGWAILYLTLALPASADWLITLEGRLIETQGPWTILEDTLTYTDQDGEEHTLDLDDVDLEASEETTALKAGKPYEPKKASQEAQASDRSARRKWAKGEKPKIILYTTSLCKECNRARDLLEELGVPFIAKDININKKWAKQYRKVAGHGGGLPVIDIDGALVFSNNPRVIRQRVQQMLERQEREAEEAKAQAAGKGKSGSP